MTRSLFLTLLFACNTPSPPGAVIPTEESDSDTDADSDADTDADTDTDTDTDLENCEDSAGLNHTRETAVPLVEGEPYRIDSMDKDWFTFEVPAATEVTVDISFGFGDIDARLRSGGVQASGITTTPNEQLIWDNTGGPATAELEVYAFGFECIPYDIELSFN